MKNRAKKWIVPLVASGSLVFLAACDSTEEDGVLVACAPRLVVVQDILAQLEGMPIDTFFEQSYRQILLRSPEAITAEGLSEAFGLRDDLLDDISDEYRRQTEELTAGILALLKTYDRQSLTPEQQTSYDIYQWRLEDWVADAEFALHHFPVSGWLSSPQNGLFLFFEDLHPVANRQNAEDYIARLKQVAGKLACQRENIALSEQAGIVPLAYMLQRALDQLAGIEPGSARQLPFYTAFEQKLAAVGDLSAADREELLEQAEEAIEKSVIPGYQALVESIEELLPDAPQDGGVWRLPDGDQYYTHLLHHYTTTDLTADEIHQLGLAEVSRIQSELRAIFDTLGYPSDESLSQLFGRVVDDGGVVAAAQIVPTYEAIIEHAEQNLTEAFDIFPTIDVIVIGGASGGYYVAGTPDGSRPGAFYAYNLSDIPRYDMATLAYHEAIPGHHTQIAIAQNLELPLFRKLEGYTGYVEGWALYAEQLADELGWYDEDIYGNLGRLQFELYRAVRLVVDTGLHAKQWTFDETVDYIVENLGSSPQGAQRQVGRYLVIPGQATAYKIGMLKLLDLRQHAQDQLGDQFDLRDFHSAVLLSGATPLNILERIVQDYIDTSS